MPQPLDDMLPRWPLLYPVLMDAGERDDSGSGEAARVRDEITAPLLDSGDIARTFEESLEAYTRWKESLTGEAMNLENVLDHEDAKENVLATVFNAHRTALGDKVINPALESTKLRRIVRESVIPHRETWPEESWHRIARLMTGSELCGVGIVEYLTTKRGSRNNVEILAGWGYQYALDAYYDAGFYGQNSTKLEDIPEQCP